MANLLFCEYIANIRALKEPVKTLDKAIEKQLQLVPNSKTLLSIKGIGLVYSAGIISEIGDINRFDTHAALAHTDSKLKDLIKRRKSRQYNRVIKMAVKREFDKMQKKEINYKRANLKKCTKRK